MGRTAKKAAAAPAKDNEDSPTQTITQSRTRRTPKPNPKYTNEAVIVTIKESEDDPVGSDADEKSEDSKVVKLVKKVVETPASVKGTKVLPGKGKPVVVKKQKLDYDEDEELEDDEKPIDEEEKPVQATRSTRSAKGGAESKEPVKVGEDSVAIVDVSSIISKAPVKAESPKNVRAAGRKRGVAEESPKEDQAKKKKEEVKPSLITSRKSYMPSQASGKRGDDFDEEIKEELIDEKKEEIVKSETLRTPFSRTRRNAGVIAESPLVEPVLKKAKVEEEQKPEPKKLPMMGRRSEITKVTPAKQAIVITKPSPTALPTKLITNNTGAALNSPKPVPRILNSMITPKGKQSPNVKLAGDGSDKKVFSIDLTDDSIKERKILASPIKAIVKPAVAVKENIANNKPQPSAVLKNKLESELMRMKASANLGQRRQNIVVPAGRQSMPNQMSAAMGARRITKFESWYVIDVKSLEPTPFRHTHSHSLIKVGNNIKDLSLPSSKWDYKLTLQRRLPRKENNNDEEVYTGDVTDKTVEADKANFEPSSILFKRSHRENNKISIDRSLMLKQNMFTITMNGKQCKLIGAPDDIKSIEDLEILLSIIDSSSLQHSCVELVTNHDIITIS